MLTKISNQVTPQEGVYCNCFFVLLIIFGFILVSILLVKSHIIIAKIKRFFSLRKKSKEEGEVKVGQENLDYHQMSSKTEKKRSFFDKIFKKEKVCEDCGTELEYREEYDSYYCPECHTYK